MTVNRRYGAVPQGALLVCLAFCGPDLYGETTELVGQNVAGQEVQVLSNRWEDAGRPVGDQGFRSIGSLIRKNFTGTFDPAFIDKIRTVIFPAINQDRAARVPPLPPISRGTGPFLPWDLTPEEFVALTNYWPSGPLDLNGDGDTTDPEDDYGMALTPPPNRIKVVNAPQYDTWTPEEREESRVYRTIRIEEVVRVVVPIFERRTVFWPG